MKIKRGSLLTVILALLCAIAFAIGVGFVLPKTETITADAAGGAANKTTFEKIFAGYYSIEGASPNLSQDQFNAGTNTAANVSCSVGVGTLSLSFTKPTSTSSGRGYVSFKAKIDVPAYTEYKVTYKFKHNYIRTRNGSTSAATHSSFMYYGADDPEAGTTFEDPSEDLTYSCDQSCSAARAKSSFTHDGDSTSDNSTPNVDITYTNNTGSVKTCYAYFGFYSATQFVGNSRNGIGLETSLSLDEEKTTAKIKPPKVTEDYSNVVYDGNNKEFKFTYDTTASWTTAYKNVKVTTTVEALRHDGTTLIADSTYNIGGLASGGIPISANGTFTAKEAGKYTLKFNLTDAAIADGVKWDDGTADGTTEEQTLTFKIAKKQLTIPKIETEPQIYNGSALTFELNSDFDSTLMSMDGVTPDITGNVVTGPGGLGLTDTSNTFQATNAGKYTVNISLRNSNNYEWKDETTDTKEAVFEVERKELVTGITCSHTVLGAAQWGQGTNGVKMTVTLDKVANQYPELLFYYDNSANVLEVASSSDTEIVVNLPNDIAVGLHNFNIVLDNENAGYNKNYKVVAPYNSYAFTVTNTESAIATMTATKCEYDGNGHFAKSDIEIKGAVHTTTVISDFTVTYYVGTTATPGNELPAGELPTEVGEYCVKITLGSSVADIYTLANDEFIVTITPKSIVAPTLGSANLVFNGLTQNVSDLLKYDKEIIELVTADSVLEGYHADTYSVYFKIKDEYKDNYVFVLPTDTHSGTKKAVKGLTAEQTSYSVTLSDNDKSAQLDWNIQKYVYDTTTSSAWNFGKEGASLSFKGVPASIVALTTGPNPTLIFDVNYYDQSYNALSEVTLSGGNKYYVAASLADCADRDDIVFKNQTYDNVVGRDISPHASYTVPKNSGLSTFFNKVKEFMTKTAVGIPVWCWFLIALALLILLIIIIVVACKRRKTKEEKEAIKAAKEEEKARKEEERQRQEEERRRKEEERAEEKRRRDEEREEEKRRREEERAEEKRRREEQLEHEREMARAKQEAELEKIRAQQAAGVGMAGMAGLAMAQQPAQPQIPPQPVQQVVDNASNELLKEMRAQMAELRADNKATQAQLQAMQNSQNQQQQAQPMQMPMYQQMPMQMPMMPQYPMYGGGNDIALARMEAQLNAMQAEQRARYDAEQRIELAAMRAESHVDRDSRHSVDLAAMREHINGYNYNRVPDYSAPQLPYNNQQSNMDMMGALVAATLKNMANGEAAATQVPELSQNLGQSTPTAKYPSDAVITTTTTVDTTKNKPIRRDENFDIDGFYDPLD